MLGFHHPVFSRLALLGVLLLVLPVGLTMAQDIDIVAPVIELEELSEGVADRTQVFTALVAEDRMLQSVTLYYRRQGQLPFTPAPMEALGNTGYYSVSIPTDMADLRTIDYYVQAIDQSGNRTVSGFAFDPYQRTLAAPATPISGPDSKAANTVEKAADRPSLIERRWVQITLGLLAVGAIATLVDDEGTESQVVPLTFNLE
ncbi:MAG: hypothetical protein HKN42_14035 [Granulosicoccus sp.]|nr:hypothetical protein [Granulosicoccus sp.]